MHEPPEKVIQRYLREQPEVRDMLKKFVLSSALCERALKAMESDIPSPPALLQIAVQNGMPWQPIRG
jgi:hypothetical protein